MLSLLISNFLIPSVFPWLQVFLTHAYAHTHADIKKKKEFDPVSFSSYVTVDEGAIGK